MRARSPILAICAVAALSVLGCDRASSTRDTAAAVTLPAPEVAQVITGELRTVDADAKTFVVRADDGTEHSFRYTDTTEVAGGSSAQGLAGSEGDRVRVSYRELPPRPTARPPSIIEATRIEMVPADTADRRPPYGDGRYCLRVRAKRDDRVDA